MRTALGFGRFGAHSHCRFGTFAIWSFDYGDLVDLAREISMSLQFDIPSYKTFYREKKHPLHNFIEKKKTYTKPIPSIFANMEPLMQTLIYVRYS
jgi:hypothetical protein